jgi:putative transposase
VYRKVTYRLYPNRGQERRLQENLRLHQQLYNAALEQRIQVWRWQRKKVTYVEQCRELTALRSKAPEYRGLNAQSSQVTLKRLHFAFQQFFRRVRTRRGVAGFPRFKALRRFSGWGYSYHGNGWRLLAGQQMRHGKLRLSGIGVVRIRGKARTCGMPRTMEILHQAGRWYASVTIQCSPVRSRGQQKIGLDWGVKAFATLAFESGDFEHIDNPRHLYQSASKINDAQRVVSRRKKGSHNHEKARRRLSALHGRVANQRQDFLHRVSARLVSRASLIATESIQVKNLTRSARGTLASPGKGVRQKAGLNQAILDTAPARFLQMLRSKAEEAAVEFVEVPARVAKASQTCSRCRATVPKILTERMHLCARCGLALGRDENAARILLLCALERSSRLPTWCSGDDYSPARSSANPGAVEEMFYYEPPLPLLNVSPNGIEQ